VSVACVPGRRPGMTATSLAGYATPSCRRTMPGRGEGPWPGGGADVNDVTAAQRGPRGSETKRRFLTANHANNPSAVAANSNPAVLATGGPDPATRMKRSWLDSRHLRYLRSHLPTCRDCIVCTLAYRPRARYQVPGMQEEPAFRAPGIRCSDFWALPCVKIDARIAQRLTSAVPGLAMPPGGRHRTVRTRRQQPSCRRVHAGKIVRRPPIAGNVKLRIPGSSRGCCRRTSQAPKCG